MECYRQGDVLLVRIDGGPRSGATVPREDGRIVLAHGEVTGHAHAIVDDAAELISGEQADELFLQVYGDEVELVHEEHDTIHLRTGCYRVVRQREYSPGEFRFVAD